MILNEDDTSNFLEAINTVRSLTSLSSSISDSIMNGIAGMLYKMIEASSTTSSIINNTTINNAEKENSSPIYHINAEFPNATDKNSILEAFESLPNIASQKVNNKLR